MNLTIDQAIARLTELREEHGGELQLYLPEDYSLDSFEFEELEVKPKGYEMPKSFIRVNLYSY